MLNLYEHQSTLNPNMPLRGLLYFARNYSSYIEQNHLDVYSRVIQKLPLSQYIVFIMVRRMLQSNKFYL